MVCKHRGIHAFGSIMGPDYHGRNWSPVSTHGEVGVSYVAPDPDRSR